MPKAHAGQGRWALFAALDHLISGRKKAPGIEPRGLWPQDRFTVAYRKSLKSLNRI